MPGTGPIPIALVIFSVCMLLQNVSIIRFIECKLNIKSQIACLQHRRIQELKLGEGQGRAPKARAEWGAEGAKKGGVWGGVFPSPQGKGSGQCPPQKNLRLGSKWRIFVDSRCLISLFNDQNSIEIHLEYKDCHGDWLACDKERYSRVSILLSPWSKFSSNSRWGAAGVDGMGNEERYPPP